MPLIKNIDNFFELINDQIVLSPAYIAKNKWKFKKITGTRLSAVLGENIFSSPVKMWAMMVGIYSESIDPIYCKIGNEIEPKIFDYVAEKTNIKYKQYIPQKIKWDVFQENKIFGGIPDGEPFNELGQLSYPKYPMLEIKTTSIDSFKFKKEGNLFILQKDELGHPLIKEKNGKKNKWFDSTGNIIIPVDYSYQLGLYCYLRNITKGLFAICFLEHIDYINPENININERDVRLIDFSLNRDEFNKKIIVATNWYNDFIQKGISPIMSKNELFWFKEELKLNESK